MEETAQTPGVEPVAQPAVAEEATSKLSWTTFAMLAFIIGLLAVLGWGMLSTNAPRPEVGQPAPDFTLQFFEGYEWDERPAASLSDMSGQVVVVNFWASWCVECRYEADVLEASAAKHAANDVVFLGVAYADVEPKSLAYMEEFDVSYPHGPDLGTDISQAYEITGVPETFVIGPDGEIAYLHIGPIDEATLNGVIEQLLEEG